MIERSNLIVPVKIERTPSFCNSILLLRYFDVASLPYVHIVTSILTKK